MKANLNILNTNLIDVVNGVVIENVNILVRDGIIRNIVHSDQTFSNEINEGTINAQNLWAIPGFVDCHVHLIEDFNQETAAFFRVDENFASSLERAQKNINCALSIGVTTMRDVGAFGGRNNLIRDIFSSDVEKYKMRLVSCGKHLTINNGHRAVTGITWNKNIELRDLVINEIKSGADFIKVMNDDIIFDVEQLTEITDACHSIGRKVACHAFTPKSIDIALKAHVDSIEHGYPYDENAADRMINQNVYLCPTYVSAFDTVNNLSTRPLLETQYPDCTFDEFRYWYDQLSRFLPQAFERNIKIISGTDAGTPPTDFQSLKRELLLFSKLGALNIQVIQTCTINAAMALGLENQIGSLEVGKVADIILLKSNPLEKISAINDIHSVISKGYIV